MKDIINLSKEEEQRASNLHRRSVVINSLESTHDHDFTPDYVNKLNQAGITAANVTVSGRDVFQGLLNWYNVIEKFNSISLVKTSDHIRKLKDEGKFGIILGLQNARPIEYNISILRILYELGIRIIQLTYQTRNLLGDGCGERTDCGLSKFGVEAVEEMNRYGILIDLSHVGKRSSMDALEISKKPVIFSHSCVRSLQNHIRNVDDEQIKALAENGGTIGLAGVSAFIRERGAQEGTTIEDYLNHVDYIVDLVGADHVGIGLDATPESRTLEDAVRFDRAWPELGMPPLMETRYCIKSILQVVDITKGLVARGYSDNEIEKILGGNFLRIFNEVW